MNSQAAAQPRMLVLARESRGWTQSRLASEMQSLEAADGKISQGYVSRAESGRLTVVGDRLDLFARALNYPAALLGLDSDEVGAGPGLLHHRKKQSTTSADLKRIHAILNLTRIQVRNLVSGVPRAVGMGIPAVEVDDFFTAADAAKKVRAEYSTSAGPLGPAVEFLESCGGIVARRDLITTAQLESGSASVPVDAVSCTPAGEDPLVLLNTGTPAERQRYTLAHELGHMVMHQVPNSEQEKQADSFAAELLMPARDIREALSSGSLTVPRLLDLKGLWRVSMWALLRRAYSLGVVSDWQYRTLAIEMTSLGYRFNEPGQLEPESPTALSNAVAWHLGQGREPDDLARMTMLSSGEFAHLYLDADPGEEAE